LLLCGLFGRLFGLGGFHVRRLVQPQSERVSMGARTSFNTTPMQSSCTPINAKLLTGVEDMARRSTLHAVACTMMRLLLFVPGKSARVARAQFAQSVQNWVEGLAFAATERTKERIATRDRDALTLQSVAYRLMISPISI
jgi:hypothetical protein